MMLRGFLKRFSKGKTGKRNYKSYDDYLDHQKEKTLDPVRRKKWLGEEWDQKLQYFESIFNEVIDEFTFLKGGKSIGLGARTGQEVEAMKNVGFDAIGIDIVPCEPLVIKGDIHSIPFDDDSFDFAFSNIFDHALYPEKFLNEVERVVKNNGIVLFHLAPGIISDEYGVNDIENTNLINAIWEKHNVIYDEPMDAWGGMNWKMIISINK